MWISPTLAPSSAYKCVSFVLRCWDILVGPASVHGFQNARLPGCLVRKQQTINPYSSGKDLLLGPTVGVVFMNTLNHL